MRTSSNRIIVYLISTGLLVAHLLTSTTQAAVTAGKLKVVTTLPDLAEAARIIGGGEVEAISLLEGTEDPHFLDAVPSFIRIVANADIVCVNGLELEIGWIPKVLAKASKEKIQPGGRGYCESGRAVVPLDKRSGPVDRSMGDVHPAGNPHFTLSPKSLILAAREITEAMIRARPESAAQFNEGRTKFENQMTALHSSVEAKLKSVIAISKMRPVVIEYHKEFSYFFDAYGLRSFGAIEEKPGVPPSAARLAEVAKAAKSSDVKLAIGALFSPERHLRKFTEISDIPHAKLPTMVQTKNPDLDTIEKLQHHIADAILQSL